MSGLDTGNEQDEPEFYGPWRLRTCPRERRVGAIKFRVVDDNGNPMCYAEDDYFLNEAIKRINVYPDMLALAREIAKEYPDAADWKDARSRLLAMANSILANVLD